MPRCTGHSAISHRRCKNNASQGSDFCIHHIPESMYPTCSICLDAIKPFMSMKIPCSVNHSHTFHKTCIKKWFLQNKDTCPVCRASVPQHIILRHDPQHFLRKTEPLVFTAPGVAHFSIPRPLNMSDYEILQRVQNAVNFQLAQLSS
jgi:hypothetical protein